MTDSSHTASNIINNHDFSDGLQSWQTNGCKAFVFSAEMGSQAFFANPRSNYAVVVNRTKCWHGLEQDITGKVSQGYTYSVSAFVGVSGSVQGSTEVIGTLKLECRNSSNSFFLNEASYSFLNVGKTCVSSGKWEKLEGTFSLSTKPDRIIFYFEGPPPGVDLLIRSVVITCPDLIEEQNTIDSRHTASNIINNHDFCDGLQSWQTNGSEAFVVSAEMGGHAFFVNSRSKYALVANRTKFWHGLEQDITSKVSQSYTYSVSAFVGVSGLVQGSTEVIGTLKLKCRNSFDSFLNVGKACVSNGKWEKFEGTFSLSTKPDRIRFYFEGPPPGVDLLIRSVIITHPDLVENIGDSSGCVVRGGDDNIILNPNFEDDLNNWSGRCCKVALHDSLADGKIVPMSGKFFASVTNRTESWNGIQQEITERVQRKLAYDVTAFVRIYGNNIFSADVRATLWVLSPDLSQQYKGIANLQATDKDWARLQGKFLLNDSPKMVVIYLEGPPAGVDILLNNLVVKHAKEIPPAPARVIVDTPYGVNIVQNSNLYDGTNGWFPIGSCTLSAGTGSPHMLPPMARDSLGLKFLSGRCIVVTERTRTWMGPAQMITDNIKLFVTYQVAGWVKTGSGASGPDNVSVSLRLDNRYWINGGEVEISDDRWHEIGGSFRIEEQPSEVMVYVHGPAAGVDFMVAGLQIFAVDREAKAPTSEETN